MSTPNPPQPIVFADPGKAGAQMARLIHGKTVTIVHRTRPRRDVGA